MIISGLYGLLDAYDPIRIYNVKMSDTLPNGTKVKTWWKHRRLGAIVEEYIQSNNPTLVHDLLPGDYREALKPWPPKSLQKITKVYEYPKEGQGSNWSRGRDLKGIFTAHIDL